MYVFVLVVECTWLGLTVVDALSTSVQRADVLPPPPCSCLPHTPHHLPSRVSVGRAAIRQEGPSGVGHPCIKELARESTEAPVITAFQAVRERFAA